MKYMYLEWTKSSQLSRTSQFGSAPILSQQEEMSSIEFVGEMYGKKNCSSLTSVWANKASRKVSSKWLPPTQDVFYLHQMRTLYRLVIWKRSPMKFQNLPDATGFGYDVNDKEPLMPKLMGQSAVAPELVNELICECSDDCGTNCQCEQHGQPCTSALWVWWNELWPGR